MSATAPRLLRPPALRTSEVGRSSSWLELFFDLVFVIAVTQLGLALAGDLSLRGYGRFALLFVPVWWAWVGYTNYADRFDSDDLPFRALVLGGMLGVAVVAVAVPDAFGDRSVVFAGAYAAVRALLVCLYGRARRHVPQARPLCDATMTVFVIGTSLWLVSLAVPEPERFGLWGLALVIEGATPWIARRAMTSVPYHASHLPERYGLFTLIVLGESLAAVAFGVHSTDWRAESILAAGLGFAGAAALWWLYFDASDPGAIRGGLLARNTFIYGHLLVAVGLTMFGVGVKESILHSGAEALTAGQRWALCGGAALFALALALIRGIAMHRARERALIVRAAAGVLVAATGLAAPLLAPLTVIAVVTAVLVGAVAIDVVLGLRTAAAATPAHAPGR